MNIYKYHVAAKGEKVFKDIDKSSGIVRAYYSAFDNKDADGDIARIGMTLKSIKETGPGSSHPRIKHFLNHDITSPISLLQEMGEDSHGPWYQGAVGTHHGGQEFIKMAESGLITEHSYMGRPTRVRKSENGRELLEMQVMEVSSLTHWGANPLTPLTGLSKSLTKEERISYLSERINSIEKFCRNSDARDETIESLLIFIKQMEQHVIDLTSTTPAVEETPEPRPQEDFNGLIAELKSFKNIYKN